MRRMYHSFDVELATKYGMVEAILLNHISFWLTKNKANNVHAHEGRYWTYSTVKALADLKIEGKTLIVLPEKNDNVLKKKG